LLEVLLNNAQRCPATTGGEAGRRPQNIVPIAFLHIRSVDTEQATGNTFEAIDQAGHRVLWRVVDEQLYVFGSAVHFDQLSVKVERDLVVARAGTDPRGETFLGGSSNAIFSRDASPFADGTCTQKSSTRLIDVAETVALSGGSAVF
jgi:hypothetical protein